MESVGPIGLSPRLPCKKTTNRSHKLCFLAALSALAVSTCAQLPFRISYLALFTTHESEEVGQASKGASNGTSASGVILARCRRCPYVESLAAAELSVAFR